MTPTLPAPDEREQLGRAYAQVLERNGALPWDALDKFNREVAYEYADEVLSLGFRRVGPVAEREALVAWYEETGRFWHMSGAGKEWADSLLSAFPGLAAQQWREISTAPKDGTQ